MTLGLAIHTASPDLGLALIDTPAPSRHQVWHLGRGLSSQVHEHLDTFIQPYPWDALDWLAVCIGPGGFTGTRIGVVIARTLAQQLEIPLFGISALAAMAANAHHNPDNPQPRNDIAVTMPAKRGAIYGAIYRPDPTGLMTDIIKDVVMLEADWRSKLAIYPSGFETIETPAGEGLGDSVIGVLKLAQLQWEQGIRPHWTNILPFYGQHPVQQ